ncbi:MAG: hypothetical protein ACLFTQ_03675 [Candidatus Aenigmatarchaeota archaeon]
MNERLVIVSFVSAFLLVSPISIGAVTHEQSAGEVEPGEEFEWEISSGGDDIIDAGVITPDSIALEESELDGSNISLVFKIEEGASPGIHVIGAEVVDEGYTTTSLFTAVAVDLASLDSISETDEELETNLEGLHTKLDLSLEDLKENITGFEEEVSKSEERIETLEERLEEMEKKVNRTEERIEEMEEEDGEESNVTGLFITRGSTIAGVIVLVVLIAYLVYKKLEDREQEGGFPGSFGS